MQKHGRRSWDYIVANSIRKLRDLLLKSGKMIEDGHRRELEKRCIKKSVCKDICMHCKKCSHRNLELKKNNSLRVPIKE